MLNVASPCLLHHPTLCKFLAHLERRHHCREPPLLMTWYLKPFFEIKLYSVSWRNRPIEVFVILEEGMRTSGGESESENAQFVLFAFFYDVGVDSPLSSSRGT